MSKQLGVAFKLLERSTGLILPSYGARSRSSTHDAGSGTGAGELDIPFENQNIALLPQQASLYELVSEFKDPGTMRLGAFTLPQHRCRASQNDETIGRAQPSCFNVLYATEKKVRLMWLPTERLYRCQKFGPQNRQELADTLEINLHVVQI